MAGRPYCCNTWMKVELVRELSRHQRRRLLRQLRRERARRMEAEANAKRFHALLIRERVQRLPERKTA